MTCIFRNKTNIKVIKAKKKGEYESSFMFGLLSDQQVALAPFKGGTHSYQKKKKRLKEKRDTHTSTMMTMSFGDDAPWIYLDKGRQRMGFNLFP